MARKMTIPKAAQIRGLKKALRNRKTPRAFIPSLKKRLKAMGGALAISMALWFLSPVQVLAQTPVTIQPIQQTLAPAGTACTGSAQTFPVSNRNQTQHWATIATLGVSSIQMEIDGIDSAGNIFRISDNASINGNITASGYFPHVQVKVTCLPNTATFTLGYSGSAATFNVNSGTYLSSQIDKFLFQGVAANVNQTITFQTPFGSSSGTLVFQYNTSGIAGSSLQVTCQGNAVINGFKQYVFNPAFDTNTQEFNIPASACPTVTVGYTSGGAATAFNLEYVFDPPGQLQAANQSNPCMVGPNGLSPIAAITVGANSTQRVVAPLADKTVSVCSLMLTVGVAGTVQISEGTGATCGTSNVPLSGAMTLAVGTPFTASNSPSLFVTLHAGDALCITTAGGATAAGLMAFNYIP